LLLVLLLLLLRLPRRRKLLRPDPNDSAAFDSEEKADDEPPPLPPKPPEGLKDGLAACALSSRTKPGSSTGQACVGRFGGRDMRKRAAVRYKLTSCGRKDAEAGSTAAVAADEVDAVVGTEEERNDKPKDEPEERFGCAEDDAEEVEEEEDKEEDDMDAFVVGAETKVH
jgi:hypothetical protein